MNEHVSMQLDLFTLYIVNHNILAIRTENVGHIAEISYNKFKHILYVWCNLFKHKIV